MYPILEAASTTPTNTFLNALLAAIPTSLFSASITYFMFRKQNIKVDKEKSYYPLIKHIFIPFHYKLERKIFHKLVSTSELSTWKDNLRKHENRLSHLHKEKRYLKFNIVLMMNFNIFKTRIDINDLYADFYELSNTIKQNKLEYYLNDDFLRQFESVKLYLEKINLSQISSLELAALNFRFNNFSKAYFKELQNSRKALGLPSRGYHYQETFDLYNSYPLLILSRFKWVLIATILLISISLIIRFL